MGCIYRHKGRETWWVKYRSAGQWQYESSHSTVKDDAVRLLRLREGDTAKGIPVTSQVGRLRYEEARDDMIAHHKVQGHDTKKMEGRIARHLTPFFARKKMSEITVATINAYIAKRKADVRIIPARTKRTRKGVVTTPERRKEVQIATINRELVWLNQMFSLALDAGKLMTRPKIKTFKEHNVRQGFLDPDQIAQVLTHLPEDLRPVVEFAYSTGWRAKSEVLPLAWHQVDLKAGEVRLEPGTTKNKEGRTLRLTKRLCELLEAQRDERDRLKRQGHIIPWVFFRMVAKGRGGPLRPKPIKSFGRAFAAACAAAGYPGRIPHDMRRSAVRNYVRAGVPERVAMQLTGHKTRSVFDRYNIVSDGDLAEAARRLDVFTSEFTSAAQPTQAEGTTGDFVRESVGGAVRI